MGSSGSREVSRGIESSNKNFIFFFFSCFFSFSFPFLFFSFLSFPFLFFFSFLFFPSVFFFSSIYFYLKLWGPPLNYPPRVLGYPDNSRYCYPWSRPFESNTPAALLEPNQPRVLLCLRTRLSPIELHNYTTRSLVNTKPHV